MPEGAAVEFVAEQAPLREVVVHQADEGVVVGGFKQVHHLVDDDVFKAFWRFFGEFGVEQDAAALRIARAPTGFHGASRI
jgi:hypothetical protein